MFLTVKAVFQTCFLMCSEHSVRICRWKNRRNGNQSLGPFPSQRLACLTNIDVHAYTNMQEKILQILIVGNSSNNKCNNTRLVFGYKILKTNNKIKTITKQLSYNTNININIWHLHLLCMMTIDMVNCVYSHSLFHPLQL